MSLQTLLMAGLCALASLHAPGRAAMPAPLPVALQIELRRDALVAHGSIVLSDIAVLPEGVSGTAAWARIDLGAAPQVGYVQRISRAQVEQLLRRRDGVLPVLVWSGADSVAVRVRAHAVTSLELADAAIGAMQAQFSPLFADVAWSLAVAPGAVDVPQGELALRVRPAVAASLPARLPVWVDLLVDGKLVRSVVVQLAAQARRPAYVARRALAAGDLADASDFNLTESEVAGTQAIGAAASLAPFRLRQPIKPGQLLASPHLAVSGQVMRGDRIRVAVKSGQIGIETAGVAMADAAPGQLLAVRPAGGSDIVTGRLGHNGSVVIE